MTLVPKLPDRYEILGTLGAGGMGTVFKVRDGVLDKIVALKVLNLGDGTADEHILRFNQEARACARLRHRNIIEILDFGFFDGVTPYMVLEYIEGRTLKQRISADGPLTGHEAKNVFAQVAAALSHAHSQKIIHRDLKPSNILVSESDDGLIIKLFDFGIARVAENADDMRLTTTNTFIGTPMYMSPEQIQNKPVDARSDIYSLGCVMFESITGEPPFSSPEMLSLIELQLYCAPPKIGEIIPSLSDSPMEALVDGCLQKSPDDRYQSCEEISKRLRFDLASDTPSDTPAPAPESQKRGSAKLFAIVGFVLIVGISATLVLLLTYKQKNPMTEVQTKNPLTQKQKDRRRELILKSAIDPVNHNELHLFKIPNYQDSDIELIPNDGTIRQLDITTPGSTRSEKNFDLSPDPLSEKGYEYVSKLSTLKGIKLHGAERVSVKAIANLAKLPKLDTFDATNTSFEDVNSLSKLKKLNYAVFTDFTSKNVLVLKDMPMEWLSLQDCRIDGPMIDSVRALKRLKILAFHGCYEVNGPALSRLNELPELNTLFFDWCRLTPGTVDSIASLRRLKRLALKEDKLKDDDLKKIATMTELENLFISGNQSVTKTGLRYLSRLPSLRKLDVANCTGLTEKDIYDFKHTRNAIRNAIEIVTEL